MILFKDIDKLPVLSDSFYTWQMEPVLKQRGLLVLSEGRTTIPAWQQVTFDCSAVSVAAAIQKLLVKSVYVFNHDHKIATPHPAWLYAVARNQILRGSRYIAPGVDVESILKAIEQYGILWMSDDLPPYDLATVDAWADSIHYQRAKLAPHLYSHYFEDYVSRCEKISELLIVRLEIPEQLIQILNAGGTVVIVSDMPLEPFDDSGGRKYYRYGVRHWQKHVMYMTDIDRSNGLIARWQLWGEDGQHGEYRSRHPLYPSGMAWQSINLLTMEFQKYKASAFGFLFKSLF
ncbi:MAG: hypothetical protein LBP87_07685 [Planctomycetaceae bacterium]|jgi:hypothetical protein|nr:hypothetical protein [Planctomycetaceae bacterium]